MSLALCRRVPSFVDEFAIKLRAIQYTDSLVRVRVECINVAHETKLCRLPKNTWPMAILGMPPSIKILLHPAINTSINILFYSILIMSGCMDIKGAAGGI